MPTLFEHAGGEAALHRLEEIFLASVLRDPLLQPLFGAGQPHHVVHLTAFTADSFGGPDRFTRELGFANRIAGGGHAGRSGVSRRGPRTRRVRLPRGDAELARRHRRAAASTAPGPA